MSISESSSQAPDIVTRITSAGPSLLEETLVLPRYVTLILLLVRRNMVVVYKQTFLGLTWYLLLPILSTIVYASVFGGLVGIQTDGTPRLLFYMAGVVLWGLFSATFTSCQNLFVENAYLMSKVYFPRLILPLAWVLTRLYSFSIQLVAFLLVWLYYLLLEPSVNFSPLLFIGGVPVAIIQVVLVACGMGLIVASISVRYRDLLHLSTFCVQLLMYVTPVVYPLSLIPERWRWLYSLNPLTPAVELFRQAFTGNGSIGEIACWPGALLTLLLFGLGLWSYQLASRNFVDLV